MNVPAKHPETPSARFIELGIVTSLVLAALVLLSLIRLPWAWLWTPAVLVGGVLLPAILNQRSLPPLGLEKRTLLRSTGLVIKVSALVLPAFAVLFWLARRAHLALPLMPAPLHGREWISWLIYQWFYVAVSEELFFRGYCMRTLQAGLRKWYAPARAAYAAVIVSSVLFALSHALVFRETTALMTFFPGLILGWLFLRSGALWAPILFHALSNSWYALLIHTLPG